MKVKIICLNVWSGGKLFENIQKYIAEEKADILCLQEVYHVEDYPPEQEWHLVSALAKLLNYPYWAFAPACSVAKNSDKRIQVGNAILSKLPIKSAQAIFFDIPYNDAYVRTPGDYQSEPRNLQHGEILIDNKVLHVFNTQGIWGFNGDDNERRLFMGDVIAREVAGKNLAVLMGDFNIKEGSETINKIEAHMTNIFKGELKTSFNMQHKQGGSFGESVVDMMFVSPGIQNINHYVSKQNVSDHLSLVGEFEI